MLIAFLLALTPTDYVLEARNGVDAQTFDTANTTNGTDQITLYDHAFGATLNPNQFRILVAVNDDRITAVRPYNTTGAFAIPQDGWVVAANGTALPYLANLAAEDSLLIRPREFCGSDGIPVLVWHDLGATSAEFETQLQAIETAGYTTITLAELGAFLHGEDPELPAHPIVLTFDDAYASQVDFAPGLLEAYGMIGTIFVITSRPGSPGGWATWAEIEEAAAAYPDSIEIGCHSHNAHFQTGGVSRYLLMTEAQRIADLETCRDTLETHTGTTPTSIAWPFGSYDEALVDLAEDAGFDLAFTTWAGTNAPDNSDAGGHVRRFGINVATAFSTVDAQIGRWYVCAP